MLKQVTGFLFLMGLLAAPFSLWGMRSLKGSLDLGIQCMPLNNDYDEMLQAAATKASEDPNVLRAEHRREQAIRELGLGFQAPKKFYEEVKGEDGQITRTYRLPWQQERALFKEENRADLEEKILEMKQKLFNAAGLDDVPQDLVIAAKDAHFKRLEYAEEFRNENLNTIESIAEGMKANPTAYIIAEVEKYDIKDENAVRQTAIRHGVTEFLDTSFVIKLVRRGEARLHACSDGSLGGFWISIQNAESGESKEIFAPMTALGIFNPLHVTAADQVMDTDTYNSHISSRISC